MADLRMVKSNPAAKLEAMRQRTDLSLEQIAKAAGYAGASSVQRYFSEELFKGTVLPPRVIERLARAMVGKGEPPITLQELYDLSGLPVDIRHKSIVTKLRSNDDTRTAFGTIAELDVRAEMGAGAIVESENVTGEWQVPTDLFRGQTSAPLGALRIITAYGDSMEPEIPPGSRVAVDTSDRKPSPPGIFVVFDGVGLVIKRVEIVPFSDPVTVRLSSDNERYQPYERVLDEAYIQGRVIGQWRWR